MEGWTRRKVLLATLRSVFIISMPSLYGCGTIWSKTIIPSFVSAGLSVIIEKALKIFMREFHAGEVLREVPQNIVDYIVGINDKLLASFEGSGVSNPFITPVIVAERGHSRYMQVSRGENQWSLVSGGSNGFSVFTIKNEWLKWLLEEDNCALIVTNHTDHGRCGIGGCNVTLSRQEFMTVKGDSIELFMPLKVNSPRELESHALHMKPWHNCEIPADCGVEVPF